MTIGTLPSLTLFLCLVPVFDATRVFDKDHEKYVYRPLTSPAASGLFTNEWTQVKWYGEIPDAAFCLVAYTAGQYIGKNDKEKRLNLSLNLSAIVVLATLKEDS